MTHQLRSRDIIALGFMTFALFVGAGNIIFPPIMPTLENDFAANRRAFVLVMQLIRFEIQRR